MAGQMRGGMGGAREADGEHAGPAALAEVTATLVELTAALEEDPQLPGAPARLLAAHQDRAALLEASGATADATEALLLAARAAAPLDPSDPGVAQRLPQLSLDLRSRWWGSADPVVAARARRALVVVDELLTAAVDRLGAASIGLADHPLVDVVTSWCAAPGFSGPSAAEQLAAAGDDPRARAAAELRAGRREQALATARTAVEQVAAGAAGSTAHVEVLLELAGVALEAEDHAVGREAAQQALALLVATGSPSHPDRDRLLRARAHHLAGCGQVYDEDPAGALADLEQAHALTRDLEPGAAALEDLLLACDVVADLAYTRRRLGDRHGDAELAGAGLERVLALVGSVGTAWPRGVLRAVGRAFASAALAQPRPELAPGPELVALAVRVLDVGCDHDPDDGHLHGSRAQLQHLLAMLTLPSDRPAAAEAHRRSAAGFEALARLEPASVWTLSARAEVHTIAAAIALDAGRASTAGRHLRDAVQLRRRLAGRRPSSPWALKRAAVAHRELARTAVRVGSRRVALGAVEAMVAAAEQRLGLGAADPSAAIELGELLEEGARLAIAVGDQQVTHRVVRRLVALREQQVAAAAVGPTEGEAVEAPDRVHELVLALLLAARTAAPVSDGPAAARARSLLDHLDAIDGTHPRAHVTRVEAHHVAANLAARAGDTAGAAEHARAALAVPAVLDAATPAGAARLEQLRALAGGAGQSTVSDASP